MDPDTYFKIIGVFLSAITGVVGVMQWSTMRRRTKLRADLDILKMYEDANCDKESCDRLRHAITKKVERAYEISLTPRHDIDKSDLTIGLISLLIAASVVLSLYYSIEVKTIKIDWEWVGIFVAVVFFFSGLVGVYKGIERKVKWLLRSRDSKEEAG